MTLLQEKMEMNDKEQSEKNTDTNEVSEITTESGLTIFFSDLKNSKNINIKDFPERI